MIGPKEGGHPRARVVIRKFGKDRSKTLSLGLFLTQISWLETLLYA